MRIFMLVSAAMLFCSSHLIAEIEHVTIHWKPETCKNICSKMIQKQLNIIQGVANTVVDEKAGTAIIRWKPRVTFTWNPINNALRTVGVSAQDVKVKVRGTINHTNSSVSLLSIGDNTKFLLLSPAKIEINNQQLPVAPQHNTVESNPLAPNAKEKLLDAEKNFEVVTIEGSLFEPWKTNSLYILIDSITQLTLQPPSTTAPAITK